MSNLDWPRELNNFLQSRGQTHLLSWHDEIRGPPHQCIHYMTAIFNGRPIARGRDNYKNGAKAIAAQQALQILRGY
ncbi:hypothetical protein HETIRDRAFT_166336 [Heterobasidion irregulare TC 32-1]|uniref:DRBM domain-containing protein n=1 Tax=Heterobasidion irregulare (strain TC 32-1) TaxID=747525 RepID=W4KN75_HETIT|nr:uncharacterized protein HETIRDRAFT_166336 [Heterobasidion irregulare TC 32-1]ETW86820.1 hypothetical protein HETIRDRAFT_166336 [Heterobasidion irregulare TC 32-1]